MNQIRQIQSLNKRELENAVPPEASWHADYRDTAYLYIGGLPFDLSEGDVVTIFSQYGEPVHVNLVRDKETGKSRGFAFLKYEDQRSTDLAVDNLSGATVLGRMLRVDHTRYKKREDEEEGDNVARLMGDEEKDADADGERRRRKRRASEERPVLKEEVELQKLLREHDEEDPMKEFLVQEKKEEVAFALERFRSEKKESRRRDGSRERSSRHHRHHRRHHEGRSRSRERSHRHRRSPSMERAHRERSPRRERSNRKRSVSRSPERRRERREHRR